MEIKDLVFCRVCSDFHNRFLVFFQNGHDKPLSKSVCCFFFGFAVKVLMCILQCSNRAKEWLILWNVSSCVQTLHPKEKVAKAKSQHCIKSQKLFPTNGKISNFRINGMDRMKINWRSHLYLTTRVSCYFVSWSWEEAISISIQTYCFGRSFWTQLTKPWGRSCVKNPLYKRRLWFTDVCQSKGNK